MKYAIAILFLTAAFPVPADDAESKKLLKDLEGSYEVTDFKLSGKTSDRDLSAKITIKGDRFTRTFSPPETGTTVWPIKVNAANKPAHIEMRTMLGIIEVDGETIKICVSLNDKTRPTEFKTTDGDANLLMTLKKIKK